MPGKRLAVLDACVLVPAPLRDTLLRLAEAPALYQARWSDGIIVEMKRALETKIGLAPARTAYLERELRRHFADCWVSGFEHLVPNMTNDPKDRHVLAAAAHARAPIIVTYNKRHFLPADASRWNVEAVGPAAFLEGLYTQAPSVVLERLRQQSEDLDRSLAAQLTILAKAVPSFVELVRGEAGLKGR